MRRTALSVLAALSLTLLAACSNPRPPAGHWQGLYEGDDVMIVARLEIGSDGVVRVSAPNAFGDFAGMSAADRDAIRERLMTGMATAWPSVMPLQLDFDGTVFRKPGGVAPQLEWDEKTKRMTLVFYAGTHAAIHFPLEAVKNFDDSAS